jgi:hypothetical protein
MSTDLPLSKSKIQVQVYRYEKANPFDPTARCAG